MKVLIERTVDLAVSFNTTELIIKSTITRSATVSELKSSDSAIRFQNFLARLYNARASEVFIEVLGHFAIAIIVAILIRISTFTVCFFAESYV